MSLILYDLQAQEMNAPSNYAHDMFTYQPVQNINNFFIA